MSMVYACKVVCCSVWSDLRVRSTECHGTPVADNAVLILVNLVAQKDSFDGETLRFVDLLQGCVSSESLFLHPSLAILDCF